MEMGLMPETRDVTDILRRASTHDSSLNEQHCQRVKIGSSTQTGLLAIEQECTIRTVTTATHPNHHNTGVKNEVYLMPA